MNRVRGRNLKTRHFIGLMTGFRIRPSRINRDLRKDLLTMKDHRIHRDLPAKNFRKDHHPITLKGRTQIKRGLQAKKNLRKELQVSQLHLTKTGRPQYTFLSKGLHMWRNRPSRHTFRLDPQHQSHQQQQPRNRQFRLIRKDPRQFTFLNKDQNRSITKDHRIGRRITIAIHRDHYSPSGRYIRNICIDLTEAITDRYTRGRTPVTTNRIRAIRREFHCLE